MSHLHKIAGRVMGEFNSFKGSRPALDNGELLVVRSVCQGNIDIHNEVDEKLDNLVKELNGREVNVVSDEAGKIINKIYIKYVVIDTESEYELMIEMGDIL